MQRTATSKGGKAIIKITKWYWLPLFFIIFFQNSCGNPSGSNPPVPAGTTWRMAVMGDSRNDQAILDETVSNVMSLRPLPQAAVHLGDFIEDAGMEAVWPQVLTSLEPLRKNMKFFPVAGNHDIKTAGTAVEYRKEMNLPGNVNYYRKDLHGIHLIFLDGTIPGQDNEIVGDQLAWLKTQLNDLASSTDFKLVFCHFIFLTPMAGTHTVLNNAAELRGLFQAAGVQAVFSAHNHYYDHQRDGGIDYFTSGGAGAPFEVSGPEAFYHFLLLNFAPDRMVVQVIGLDGLVKATVTVPR